MVDLLLEVQAINAKEGEAKIRALGARIRDPRARVWFLTAGTYFLNNIELLDQPYAPRPVEHPPGAHHTEHPFGPPQELPAENPEFTPHPSKRQLSPELMGMIHGRKGTEWFLNEPGEANVVDVGYAPNPVPINPDNPDSAKTHRTEIDPKTGELVHGHPKTVHAKKDAAAPPTAMSRDQWDAWKKAHAPGSPLGDHLTPPYPRQARALVEFLLEAGEPYLTSLHQPAWQAMRASKRSGEDSEDVQKALANLEDPHPQVIPATAKKPERIQPRKFQFSVLKRPEDDEGKLFIQTDTPDFLATNEARKALAAIGYVVDDDSRVEPVEPDLDNPDRLQRHAGGHKLSPDVTEGPKGVLIKRIESEFEPYDPSTAPDPEKARFGGPAPTDGWPEVSAPSWAASAQDVHAFKPLRWDERTFWKRMEALVVYLNALSRDLQLAGSSNKEDVAKAAAAEKRLASLGTQKLQKLGKGGKYTTIAVMPRDHNVFLNVLADAEAHAEAADERGNFGGRGASKSKSKLMNVRGTLRLRLIDVSNSLDEIMRVSSEDTQWVLEPLKPGFHGELGQTTRWCVKGEGQATTYRNQGGNFYLVTKKGENYALVQLGDPKARNAYGSAGNADNKEIGPNMARELAPLFAPFDLNWEDNGTPGYLLLKAAVEELQGR